MTRPAFEPPQGLDTPPITDLESSVIDSESDFLPSDRDSHASDADAESDAELGRHGPVRRPMRLSDIPESGPGSPALGPSDGASTLDDSWSVINESDADADADVEHDLANSVASLDLDPGVTPRPARQFRQGPLGSNLWERQRRAASSPSRSPARAGRNPPRVNRPVLLKTKAKVKSIPSQAQSFYDYLFA